MSIASATGQTLELAEMNGDVSSREAAQAWLGRRIRKLGLGLLLGIALSPVASAFVVAVVFIARRRELPPLSGLVESSLAWTVVIVPIIVFVTALIALKYMKFAKRVGPIVRNGAESSGRVVDVQFSSRKSKSGVLHGKVTLTVQADGAAWIAAIEESQGTKLPKVDVGAPAKVWTLGGRAVVGTSGSLFESE
jgi:hypothetical protein